MRKLTFMHKTSGSGNGSCPALYATDDGGYVVQGKFLAPDDVAQLRDLGDDETAVWIPADVIDRLRAG